jgi:hypothetical protein
MARPRRTISPFTGKLKGGIYSCRLSMGALRGALSSTVIQHNDSGFQALLIYIDQDAARVGLNMLNITNPTVTREQVWGAFRQAHEVRLRERDHGIWLLRDGKSGTDTAQWLYRNEETIRSWVHAANDAGCQGWNEHRSQGDRRDL